MSKKTRQIFEEYLTAVGRMKPVALGGRTGSAAPPVTEDLGDRFATHLAAARKLRTTMMVAYVAMLVVIFGLGVGAALYLLASPGLAAAALGGTLTLLLAVVGKLRRIWIDKSMIDLVSGIVRDLPPAEAVKMIEIVYWNAIWKGGKVEWGKPISLGGSPVSVDEERPIDNPPIHDTYDGGDGDGSGGSKTEKSIPADDDGDGDYSLGSPRGYPEPKRPESADEREPIHVTTVAPEAVRPGDRFKVEIVFHIGTYEVEAAEGRVVEGRAAVLPALRVGARLTVRLVSVNDEDAFDIHQSEWTGVWNPPFCRAEFRLQASDALRDGVYDLLVEYWCERVKLTYSYLEIAVAADAPPQRRSIPVVTRRLPRSAFASYSHLDRGRVAERVDALEAVGIDVFLDCLDIKPAREWEQVLRNELLTREKLLLFWSSHARSSKWVDREWRFALEHHGKDSIVPNALEPPEVCPPPYKLRHLQFGSVLLELMEKWQQENKMRGRSTE